MGIRQADQRSPLTITALAAGGAVVLALLLGPVAAAATSDASRAAAAKADTASQPVVLSSGEAFGPGLELPETGAINLKPYLVGGGVFLVAGGGLLARARRRGIEPEAEIDFEAEAAEDN